MSVNLALRFKFDGLQTGVNLNSVLLCWFCQHRKNLTPSDFKFTSSNLPFLAGNAWLNLI
nr:hypothetical protein [uncultured Campylobacter sp.]